MNQEALKARREYFRQWRKEHPDKVREYQRKYWERKAQTNNPSEKAPSGGDSL